MVRNSDEKAATKLRLLSVESLRTSGERMWTRVQIGLGTEVSCVTHRFRYLVKSAPTESLLSESEVHRLQSGCERAHDAHTEVDDVRRRQVRISDATSGLTKNIHAGVQILPHDSGAKVDQRFKRLAPAVV